MNPKTNETNLPKRIGRFRIERMLGEGGMGTVFLGIDDHLGRRVAIKVIREDHRLDAVRQARMLREARTLAQLNHPGISHLHEYVEDDHADFLVMELVEGRSLREVIAERVDRATALGIARQLLEILIAVHGAGVIHRDLKPENMMITADGTLKVLDFGLAREDSLAADPSNAEVASHGDETTDRHQRLTSVGSLVGTVDYMSPEQARGETATAASDLYAVGLILQELLTGRLPFRTDGPAEARLRRAMWGETEPVDGLPQDLTRFVERLKELEPAARPTAIDAAEILRTARERPRRRRRQFGIVSAIVILALFAAGMTAQFLRAERERQRAERERASVEQVADFLVGLFEAADPWSGGAADTTAREIVDQGARSVDDELSGQPLIKARIMHTLGEVYAALGQFDAAAHFLWQAVQLRKGALGEDHPDVVESLLELGIVHRDAGRFGFCRQSLEPVVAIQSEQLPANHPERAKTWYLLSTCLAQSGETDRALEMSGQAVEVLSGHLDPTSPSWMRVLTSHAFVLRCANQYDDAERVYRELLSHPVDDTISERLWRAAILNNYAYLLKLKGDVEGARERYTQAAEIQREHLAEWHPRQITTLTNLAGITTDSGDFKSAEALFRRVVALSRKAHPEGHTNIGTVLVIGLGGLHLDLHRYDQAETVLLEGIRELEGARKRSPEAEALAQGALAAALVGQGRIEEAESLVAKSAAVLTSPEPLHSGFLDRIRRLIGWLEDAGRPDLADHYRHLVDE